MAVHVDEDWCTLTRSHWPLDANCLQVYGILEATTHGGNKELEKALFSHADAVTTKYFGDEIYYRGIVEFSNVCQNDCNYCGIRKHMHGVHRCAASS